MTSGKISNALRCLDENQKGQVLSLNDKIKGQTVYQALLDKHPKPSSCHENYKVQQPYETTLPFHPTIFDKLNSSAIRRSAMKTHGSHGPSGLDANEWRRILTNFHQSSTELCKTIAILAHLIATTDVEKTKMTA